MNNNVIKKAKKFLRRDLCGKVSVERIREILKGVGYVVIFHDADNNIEILNAINQREYAEKVRAFTFREDDLGMVFIKRDLSYENKLYSLLHETGHIILGHMETDEATENTRLQEMEAEAFAYGVLDAMCKDHRRYLFNALCLAVVSFIHSFKKEFPTDCLPYLLADERGNGKKQGII